MPAPKSTVVAAKTAIIGARMGQFRSADWWLARQWSVAAALPVVLMLCGCTQTFQAYHGAERPDAGIATIKCCIANISRIVTAEDPAKFVDGTTVYDESRDEDSISKFTLLSAEISLRPGKYRFYLQQCSSHAFGFGGCKSNGTVFVELIAGHDYEVDSWGDDMWVKDRTSGIVIARPCC